MTEPVGDAAAWRTAAATWLDEAHGPTLAGVLAALAGMVDAIGYLRLGHLFVSFMSGNSTQLAVAVGRGDLTEACIITELIAPFVLGAAAGRCLPASPEMAPDLDTRRGGGVAGNRDRAVDVS